MPHLKPTAIPGLQTRELSHADFSRLCPEAAFTRAPAERFVLGSFTASTYASGQADAEMKRERARMREELLASCLPVLKPMPATGDDYMLHKQRHPTYF